MTRHNHDHALSRSLNRSLLALALVTSGLALGASAGCMTEPSPPDDYCGDHYCNSPWENQQNCPVDCPAPPVVCGDGVCSPGENCAADCPDPTPVPDKLDCQALANQYACTGDAYEAKDCECTQKVASQAYIDAVNDCGDMYSCGETQACWSQNAPDADLAMLTQLETSCYQNEGRCNEFLNCEDFAESQAWWIKSALAQRFVTCFQTTCGVDAINNCLIAASPPACQ